MQEKITQFLAFYQNMYSIFLHEAFLQRIFVLAAN